MGSEVEQFGKRLEELGHELEGVRERLDRLEAREASSGATAPPAVVRLPFRAEARGSDGIAPGPPLAGSVVALLGRTLVVLGGAYLLRALSDRGLIPPLLGAGAALAYAMLWLALCDRAAARGQGTSATFHGLSATLIAYPLLWETTAVFGLIPPAAAAFLMLAVLVAVLAVAARRELRSLAWAAALAHLAASSALLVGTGALLPLSLALIGSAAAVEWPVIRDGWPRLRWPVSFAADTAALVLAVGSVRVLHASGVDAPGAPGLAVVCTLMALPLLYLASVAERTVWRGEPISGFEIGQVALALTVGIGASAWVQAARGAPPAWLGATALLLGAACYAVAFAFVEPRSGRGSTFYASTTFAALLLLAGSALWLTPGRDALAASWGAFAAAALALGAFSGRITLRFHGAVYAMAAAAASGLAPAAGEALIADPESWRPLSAAMLVVLALVLGGCLELIATARGETDAALRLPQAALALLGAVLIAGLATRGLAPLALAVGGEASAPTALAALRSAVLAGLAIALAAAGRRWPLPELRWPVYPVFALGGAKLVWEDLRLGDPVALFAAFTVYGAALIAASRLLRRPPGPAPADPLDPSAAPG